MIPAEQTTRGVAESRLVRVRPDVRVEPVRLRSRWTWRAKDPATQRYFQLREEEYFVWRRLDGGCSLADIQSQFDRRFAPQRLTDEELRAFIASLDTAGLLLVESPTEGERLWKRSRLHAQRERRARWINPLMIRFRGVNPEPFLRWLTPRLNRLWTSRGLAAAALLIASAVLLAIIRWDDLAAALPDTQSFLTPENLIWLAATLAGIKLLHELGHAATCHRFGGECHELGVMLLVFAPTLYCNVSDSWTLPSKWQRAAIASAGVAVELVLAAAAMWLWWLSEPGLVHTLCLNVMLVGSINTLVFNGNPLLRFDGYYVLSDVMEVPNLREQADAAWRGVLVRALCGRRAVSAAIDETLSRVWLIGYGAAAWVYRWAVLFGIFWFLHRTLNPFGLGWLTIGLALPVVGQAALHQLSRGRRFVREELGGDEATRRRMRFRGGLIAAALAAGLLIPLPCSVRSPAVLEPRGAPSLYVTIPGRIQDAVREGTSVEAGQRIARLENDELDRDIARLTGQRNQQRILVESLKRRQVSDRQAAARIPTATEALTDIEERLRQRELDHSRLTLTAPVAGIVLPVLSRAATTPAGGLRTWSGQPLDESNRGAFLETGTLVCRIGDPRQQEALVFVAQDDIALVRSEQAVRLQFDALPSATLTGTVVELSAVDDPTLPWPLLARGDLAVTTDRTGQPRPLTAVYQVRVSLAPHDHDLPLGSVGQARIRVTPISLGSRILRAARRTFRLEL